MAKCFYYYVHKNSDPDSEIIFKGKNGAVTRRFGLDRNKLGSIFHHGKPYINGTYFVERIEMSEVPEQKIKRKPRTKLDETVDMVEHMLDIYGNTIIYKDFKKVEARLNADGYFIKAKHEPERRIKHSAIGSNNGHCEVYDECWILELVRRERIINVD